MVTSKQWVNKTKAKTSNHTFCQNWEPGLMIRPVIDGFDSTEIRFRENASKFFSNSIKQLKGQYDWARKEDNRHMPVCVCVWMWWSPRWCVTADTLGWSPMYWSCQSRGENRILASHKIQKHKYQLWNFYSSYWI